MFVDCILVFEIITKERDMKTTNQKISIMEYREVNAID